MDHLKVVKETVNHIYWSLLLQGALFIALAFLIVLYPVLLFALVAATFMVVGMVLLGLAWRVRSFWSKMPDILKK